MNEALQRWREDFAREPDTAFDRLVRGLVPLGAAGQLSFGEILDGLFEPGDAALDKAVAGWLEKHILGALPDGTSLHRWVSVIEEFFLGIAAMELPKTGEVLRCRHERILLWLLGFYEGADRDPGGAYLLALARAQDDQRFSSLWRRLILGEKLAGRPYLGIGILGFRKMPGPDGRESSDVPEGLLQALVQLADKLGTGQDKWKQTMRSLFASYRRSESYWVEHLAPILPHHEEQSNAREWLSDILRGIPRWRPTTAAARALVRHARRVPIPESLDWVKRVAQNPTLCETPEFSAFLDHHRLYAQLTGDSGFLNKSFNNLATTILRVAPDRGPLAVALVEEALKLKSSDPQTWTIYAGMLLASGRGSEALATIWKARQRFPWDSYIRNELARILRKIGDLVGAEGVLRETVSHFPSDDVCRNALAEVLRARGQVQEARTIYEQTCKDFPHDVFSRSGLADLLIDLNLVDEADLLFRAALRIEPRNRVARGGLARAVSIRGARTRSANLREEATNILKELAADGDGDARRRLQDFDVQWRRGETDPTFKFRREAGDEPTQSEAAQGGRTIADMSVAERLGRAMITLWQAERTENATLRSSLCAHATALLEVAEDKIDDDLLAAFVETRGLVTLASGDAQRALAYFEEQIRRYGRGGWIGIQLGDQRARIALGVPNDADDTVEAPSSQSAGFALNVARVIQTLSASPQESEVRHLLKALYPRAAKFAARAQQDAQEGLSIESGAEMLGAFLQTRWFRPAGIQSTEDLDRPDALHAVVERINNTRTDTFDVISNSTLAIAA